MQKAFTLVELVTVLSIISVVGGLLIAAIGRQPTEAAQRSATLDTMGKLAKALQKFRADMGYYPGTGPFDPNDSLFGTPGIEIDTGALTNISNSPNPSLEEITTWMQSDINFWPLFYEPDDDVFDDISGSDPDNPWRWNPIERRGWDGPYLNRGRVLQYEVNPNLRRIQAISDGFSVEFSDENTFPRWLIGASNPFEDNTFPDEEFPKDPVGRPITLEIDTATDAAFTIYRLRSAGLDGNYGNSDDIALEVSRERRY